MTPVDHYATLGIRRDAPPEVVRGAWRALAQSCHPDRHGGDAALEACMSAINAAYETLGDPERRAAYDRSLFLPRASVQAPTPRPARIARTAALATALAAAIVLLLVLARTHDADATGWMHGAMEDAARARRGVIEPQSGMRLAIEIAAPPAPSGRQTATAR